MTTIRQAVDRFVRFLRVGGRGKTYPARLRDWTRWVESACWTADTGEVLTLDSPIGSANDIHILTEFVRYTLGRRKRNVYDKQKMEWLSGSEPLNQNTVRGHVHALRALFVYCMDPQMWMPAAPPLVWSAAAAIKMPKMGKKHKRWTSPSAVLKVLDHLESLPDRKRKLWYAILLTFGASAVRRYELVNLEVSDWDSKSKTMNVRIAKGQNPRSQPVDSVTAQAINDWLAVRGNYVCGRWVRLTSNKTRSGWGGWKHVPDPTRPNYLFVHDELHNISMEHVTEMIGRLSETAGVERITPHMIRRLAATRVFELTHDIRAVMAITGHTSERTAWEYIAIPSDEDTRTVLERIQIVGKSPSELATLSQVHGPAEMVAKERERPKTRAAVVTRKGWQAAPRSRRIVS